MRDFCIQLPGEVKGDGPFVPAPGLMITHESGGRKQKDRPLLCLKLFILCVCIKKEIVVNEADGSGVCGFIHSKDHICLRGIVHGCCSLGLKQDVQAGSYLTGSGITLGAPVTRNHGAGDAFSASVATPGKPNIR